MFHSFSALVPGSRVALALSAALCLSPMTSTNVMAQSGAEEASRIEEITVTARRREERLLDAPVAISAFSAEDVRAMGIDSPKNFLNQTPAVYFRSNTTSGTAFVNIRGISASRNAESPVAVVVDGVYLNNPLGFQNELTDIQQIEILKGPQGALYGRNASAGAIIITTKQPSKEFEGTVTAGYGRNNWNKVEASFSGPILDDRILFRVSAYQRGVDGFFKNTFLSTPNKPVYQDPLDNNGVRARLLFNPDGMFRAEVRASRTETSGGFNDNPGLASGVVTGDEDIVFSGQNPAFDLVTNVRSFSNRDTRDFSVKLDWDTAPGSFTSISSYSKLEEISGGDAQPLDSVPNGTQGLLNTYETFSQEFRFTSPSDRRLRYIAGAYWATTDRVFASSGGVDRGAGLVITQFDPVYGIALSGPTSANPSTGADANFIDQNAWAVFGQLEYDITDRMEFSAALRYDEDDEKARSIVTTNSPALFVPGDVLRVVNGSTYAVRVTDGRKANFARWQPKATLSYKVNDWANVYATYAEGFKNGGFNGVASAAQVAAVDGVFLPEVVKTIEGGFKTNLLDSRLAINGAVYRNEVENFNYFEVFFGNNRPEQVNGNLDEVEFTGVELEFNYRLTDALRVTGSMNVIDSEIVKSTRFAPTAAPGQRAPYFPKNSYAAMVDWVGELGRGFGGFANLQFNHIGSVQWDLRGQVVHDPQNFIDARVGLTRGDAFPWRFTLFCRNCTNNDYIIESLPLIDNAIVPHFMSRDSRLFGFEVSKDF